MHLRIEEFKWLNNIFLLMGTLTDFGSKQEDILLQSFGDKLPEINSLIDWKSFLIILESYFLTKQSRKAYLELK
jgi:hypothetical protein